MNVTIKIKLENKDIELTLEEARELLTELQEVFEKKPDPGLPAPTYVPVPSPWYDPPIRYGTAAHTSTTFQPMDDELKSVLKNRWELYE